MVYREIAVVALAVCVGCSSGTTTESRGEPEFRQSIAADPGVGERDSEQEVPEILPETQGLAPTKPTELTVGIGMRDGVLRQTSSVVKQPSAITLPSEQESLLRQRYKIEVVASDKPFCIEMYGSELVGLRPSQSDVDKFTSLLYNQISLYPVELVEKCRLRRVVLCRDLRFRGQIKSGKPHLEQHTIYFNASRNRSQLEDRSTIHHELFHLIDHWYDGRKRSDQAWAAINPVTFAYGIKAPLHDAASNVVSMYSTKSLAEDKAEVYAAMMTDPVGIEHLARSAHVIDWKMKHVTDLLAAFCPQVDESFWRNVRANADDAGISPLALKDVYASSGPKSLAFGTLDESTVNNIRRSTSIELPVLSFETSEKLKAKIRLMHIEALAEHSCRVRHAPTYSVAQSAKGKLSLVLLDCRIASANVAPDLTQELKSKYDIEVPIVVDFAVGDDEYYVHVRRAMNAVPQTQNQEKPE